MEGDTSIRGWPHRLAPGVGVVLFGVALYVLHRELELIRLHEVLDQVRRIPATALLAAVAASTASYLILTQYDGLALRYVGDRVGLKRSSLAAHIGFAFGQNVGFTVFSGAPMSQSARRSAHRSVGARARLRTESPRSARREAADKPCKKGYTPLPDWGNNDVIARWDHGDIEDHVDQGR